MAKLKIRYRRRISRKTDYKLRLGLLKSGIPRIVIRKTNKYIIAEIINSKEAKDFVVCHANSKELSNFGWNLSFKNIPAAYLTGFLLGTKAKKASVKKAIIDIGIQRSTKGNKIYAAIKGAIDAGLDINCDEKIIPSKERIEGKHIKKEIDINKIKEKIK